MASLYKRGDNYYLAFHQSNQTPNRKHVSLRASSYKVAQQKAARLIVRYEKGEYDPWRPTEQPKTQTLAAAATAFLQTRRNLSKQSVAKYRSVLGQLVQHAGRKTALDLLTTAKVQSFIDASDRRAITKRTYSTTLSPFFNWAVADGLIEKNQVRGPRLPRVPEKTPKTHSILTVQDQTVIGVFHRTRIRSTPKGFLITHRCDLEHRNLVALMRD
jgi:hypothetical protein